jgi:hypothetical protein
VKKEKKMSEVELSHLCISKLSQKIKEAFIYHSIESKK